MKKILLPIAAISLFAISGPAMAVSLTGLEIGAGVSPTSGVGGFVGYHNPELKNWFWKRIGVRADFATTSPIKSLYEINDYEIDDENYDFVAESRHMGAMLDIYPFGNTYFLGGIRVSGGYVDGKMNATAETNPMINESPIFEIGDEYYLYNGSGVISANGDWKFSGPYLGMGFNVGLFAGLKIYMDAGVVFTDKPDIGYNVPLDGLNQCTDSTCSVTTPVTGDPAAIALLNTEINNQIEQIKDDINFDKMKYYPMLKLGLMYRF